MSKQGEKIAKPTTEPAAEPAVADDTVASGDTPEVAVAPEASAPEQPAAEVTPEPAAEPEPTPAPTPRFNRDYIPEGEVIADAPTSVFRDWIPEGDAYPKCPYCEYVATKTGAKGEDQVKHHVARVHQ